MCQCEFARFHDLPKINMSESQDNVKLILIVATSLITAMIFSLLLLCICAGFLPISPKTKAKTSCSRRDDLNVEFREPYSMEPFMSLGSEVEDSTAILMEDLSAENRCLVNSSLNTTEC